MKHLALAVFIVSWPTGTQFVKTDCVGKEPAGIVCAKSEEQHAEKRFNTEEAANEFAQVLIDSKIPGVKMDKKDK